MYGTTGTISFSRDSTANSMEVHCNCFRFILLLAGFAFKISVVPFHLWTADVYEGSPYLLLLIYL
jgi:NADH-quinone oxidoreductase subunit N